MYRLSDWLDHVYTLEELVMDTDRPTLVREYHVDMREGTCVSVNSGVMIKWVEHDPSDDGWTCRHYHDLTTSKPKCVSSYY
jgi:hypothetical protein